LSPTRGGGGEVLYFVLFNIARDLFPCCFAFFTTSRRVSGRDVLHLTFVSFPSPFRAPPTIHSPTHFSLTAFFSFGRVFCLLEEGREREDFLLRFYFWTYDFLSFFVDYLLPTSFNNNSINDINFNNNNNFNNFL